MQILGTFQSRDVADSVKDAFLAEGFPPSSLVVMVNRETPEPPEDARLEIGTQGEPGFLGIEEKIGKAVRRVLRESNKLEGDGDEGHGKGGALLAVTVPDEAAAERVKSLLATHQAGDIEVAQAD